MATPTGNVTHYKLLRTLEHLGVDASKVEIVQMNGADAAVALVRGDVTMACAFGGPIDRMKTVGKPLMTGAEQEAAGINTFDIISVTDSFAAEHPELVKKFLAVTGRRTPPTRPTRTRPTRRCPAPPAWTSRRPRR